MHHKKFIYQIENQEEKENPTEKKRDGLEKKAVSKTAQDCGQKKYLFLPKTPAKENEKVMSDNISMTSDTKSTSKSASGITYKWCHLKTCMNPKNHNKTLKFGVSEKATKFEKIFVVLLTRASCSVRATAYLSKSRRRFFKTNVVKSYYTNFTTFDCLDFNLVKV